MQKKIKTPGIIISTILFLIMAEFVAMLFITDMFPMMTLAIAAIVLLIVLLFVYLLVQDLRKKVRFAFGTLIAIILIIAMVLGNLYVFSTMNTLQKISNANTQTSQIGIYVRTDDPAQELEDARDYTFGILSNIDTENTNSALNQIDTELEKTVETVSYDGVMDMVDALLNEECGAIILNYAYIPVLEDIDGYEDIDSQIRELSVQEVEKVIEDTEEEETNSDVLQFFISGIDTRGTSIINTRSDVNIVAMVNTKTKQILLVSTPRDYFVPLSISNGAKDKLTHAGIYGTQVSMDTLNMLYDTDINYYFKVNFSGFVDIIDALGGVSVYSDYDFSTGEYSFTKGYNDVDGTAALAFARERHAFSEGDRQRGKDQMYVITAVINKMMSTEMLKNYTSILESVEGSFETNMSYSKIAELVKMQLEEPSSWDIIRYSVDGTGDTQVPYSMSVAAYVMQPDQTTVDKAKELMQKMLNNELISDADTQTTTTSDTSSDAE